ncbi:MAG: type II toxin-antitoxin system VapB family antitoxin [Pseudonocardia sp.]|nr:type II toxin-antitoxin system VapB family antitoxin [Pseudonocardia sp.]
MAITTIDINEEYLEGARRVLGTTSKVDTVNQALKSVSNKVKRQELVEMLASGDGVELDVIDEAWR